MEQFAHKGIIYDIAKKPSRNERAFSFLYTTYLLLVNRIFYQFGGKDFFSEIELWNICAITMQKVCDRIR
jgi:hypothetical protein